ncbi:MAG TPA: hypothetical protein DCS43_13610 [Verrucomicrobia bacterium]|nr:hypothetical protein [Verrucomicrobiota bacterium]
MKADSIIKRILSAPVYDVVIDSPVDTMPLLGKRLGCNVLVKRFELPERPGILVEFLKIL